MAEVSKQVADWALVVRTVSSALTQQGPELAGPLEKELFPDGAPDKLTVAGFLDAMRATLERKLEDAQKNDLALAVERADDPAVREERDAAVADLRTALLAARSSIEGAFGSGAVVRTALDGRLADSPDQLVGQAEASAKLLTDTDLGKAAPGIQIDGAKLAKGLSTAADRLSTALAAVQRESRQEQQKLHARDTAVAALSRCYSGLADATTGLATVAGRDDVANRVRPTARRRNGLPDGADAPAQNASADATANASTSAAADAGTSPAGDASTSAAQPGDGGAPAPS